MEFLETATFTSQILELLKDDEYSEFQLRLGENPEMGDLIPQGGGIRKVRVAARSHGKRGGARVIYYWAKSKGQILLLLAYAKNALSDLTPKQAAQLGIQVKKEFNRGS